MRHNFCMHSTINLLLQQLATLSHELSFEERRAIDLLLSAKPTSQPASPPQTALLRQNEVVSILKLERTTIWRLARDGILRKTEISPGTFRYHRNEVEYLAQHGYRDLLKQRRKVA